MNIILTYLPFTLSILIGYFLISITFRKAPLPHPFIHIFLACGLGLGTSAQITFLSYFLFDRLHSNFVISLNVVTLIVIFITHLFQCKKNHSPFVNYKNTNYKDFLLFLTIVIFAIPFWIHAHFYADGGWDAWSVWNLKARIMFLGDTGWRHIFEPILWRSSPHYPLLLPLTNVWGWTILGEPTYKIPVFTSFFYTFLTVNLLCFGLKKYTQTNFSVLPVIVLLTLPFYVKLGLNQYSENILGFYLLASLFCLITAKSDQSTPFSFLSGIFIGFMSFTKGEAPISRIFFQARFSFEHTKRITL